MRMTKMIRMILPLFFVLGVFLAIPAPSSAQISVGVRVGIAPPPLPDYEQPECPGDGYIWTPGYWAWDSSEYYWVPGTWVEAPEVGYLWTPGYWGWDDGGYFFNEGYWGTSVGFYGGINYGFGYFGRGYDGGRWDNGHFSYNGAYNRVDERNFHNVYNTRVNEGERNHVSFNGGNGVINVRASAEEESAARERHMGPAAVQSQHSWAARNNPQQKYSANHGAPPVTATPRANMAGHPRELPPVERPAYPNAGNTKADQRYQKQQDQLIARQSQDRQKLQQQQDKEHQQLTRQQAPPERTQQVEQRHQQQTQQLQQRHTQQTQQLQQRQPSSGGGGGSRSSGGGGRH